MSLNVGEGPSIPPATPHGNSGGDNSVPKIDFPKPNETTAVPSLIKGRLKRYPPLLTYDEFLKLSEHFSIGDVEKASELLNGRSLPSVLSWGNFKDVKDLARLAIKNPNKQELLGLLVNNLNQHPGYEKYKYDLLCFAIEENSLEAVDFLLKNSVSIAPPANYSAKLGLDIAIEKQFLSVGKLLKADFLDLAVSHLAAIKDPKELKGLLLQGFLNSSVHDSLAVIKKLKSILDEKDHRIMDEVLKFIKNEGSLIARFPESWKHQLMISSYNANPLDIGKDAYNSMQIRFAEKRLAIFEAVLNEMQEKNLDFVSCYVKLMQPRSGEKQEQYLQLRHKSSSSDSRVTTPITDRYRDFMNLANDVYNHSGSSFIVRSKSTVYYQPEKQDRETQAYTINITLRNGKSIPLTKVHFLSSSPSSGVWEHTSKEYLDEIEKEQIQIFEEIKSEKSFPELKRKIAYFYYLGIHAMYSFRGNSQNMLEMHKMCYLQHNIHVPPPNQKFVLPDCVALCLPFEEFYNNYYDKLWETPITQ